jgi:uncharacterized membrane protein
MIESTSIGIVHLGVAFGLGRAITGNAAVAGSIALLEPAVNTVVHYLFDRRWGHSRWSAVAMRLRGAMDAIRATGRGAP